MGPGPLHVQAVAPLRAADLSAALFIGRAFGVLGESAPLCSVSREYDCIEPEQAANSVGNVLTRESRAADILYVLSDLDGIRVAAANELLAPTGITNLASISLAVFQNLYLADVAIQGERYRLGDQVVSTDNGINEKVSIGSPPRPYDTGVIANATFTLDAGDVGRTRVDADRGQSLLRKHQCLSLLDAQVHRRVGRLANGRCGDGQEN